MLPEHRALLEDEPCPVADEILGEMYRASAHGLNELIATVSPTARVLLAVYCYRRAHFASIGLAIAATCDKDNDAFSSELFGAPKAGDHRDTEQVFAGSVGIVSNLSKPLPEVGFDRFEVFLVLD